MKREEFVSSLIISIRVGKVKTKVGQEFCTSNLIIVNLSMQNDFP